MKSTGDIEFYIKIYFSHIAEALLLCIFFNFLFKVFLLQFVSNVLITFSLNYVTFTQTVFSIIVISGDSG